MLMKKNILLIFALLGFSWSAQDQFVQRLPDVNAPELFDNVHRQKLFEDELSSTFVIWVQDQIAPHTREYHTEQAYILEGKAEYIINGEKVVVKEGDVVFMPAGSVVQITVKSREPLKALITFSPKYDDLDMIFVD